MKTYLLIGGVADGRRIAVPDDRNTVAVAEQTVKGPAIYTPTSPYGGELLPTTQLRPTLYEKRKLYGCTAATAFFVEVGLNPDEVIEHLLRSYRRQLQPDDLPAAWIVKDQPDGPVRGLYNTGPEYLNWQVGEETVMLDGEFTPTQLLAIAATMGQIATPVEGK